MTPKVAYMIKIAPIKTLLHSFDVFLEIVTGWSKK